MVITTWILLKKKKKLKKKIIKNPNKTLIKIIKIKKK